MMLSARGPGLGRGTGAPLSPRPGLAPLGTALLLLLLLLALGVGTARGQGCANQRNDVQIPFPEPPDGIQNLGSNPTYRGPIVIGTPAGTTLDFYFDSTTTQAVRDAANKVRIDRDASGSFFLQMTTPIDRDGPTANSTDDENQIRFVMKCVENGVDYFFEVRLTILDINDNSPLFILPNGLPYAASVNELTPVGTSVYVQISATDKDNGPNKEIEYSLIPGNGQIMDGYQKFAILRPSNGFVTVKDELDFESLNAIGQTSYILNVSATDLAQPPAIRRRSFTTLNITIADGDDLGPEFVYTSCFKYRSVCLNPEYTASVVSGTTTGRLTVNSVPADSSGSVLIQAKDQDTLNYPLTFSIETTVPAGYNGYFTVNTVGPTGGLYEAQITQIQAINTALGPNFRIILGATETSTNSRFNRATIYLTANESQLSTTTTTLPTGASIGIGVVIGIFICAVIAALAYLLLRRREPTSEEHDNSSDANVHYDNVGQQPAAGQAAREEERHYNSLQQEMRDIPRDPSDYAVLDPTSGPYESPQ